ncbi:MAG TPA: hypothetical protein PLK15_03490 [Chitinophagales bacterium]|nr:hypothetical protein [Chitinophagales bacterium]
MTIIIPIVIRFEIKLYKPEYDIEKGKHRYFLQNIYQLQMNHINKDEL